MSHLIEVAVKSPLRRFFTYESDQEVPAGCRVRVPWRTSEKIGMTWGASETRPEGLKSLIDVIDQTPLLSDEMIQFLEVAIQYYGLPAGEFLSASLPKKIKEGKEVQKFEDPDFQFELPELNEAQAKIVEHIQSESGYQQSVLMGETGSGKTEVYLHLAKSLIEEGGQVLFLVPEISLTPQLESRLRSRIGGDIQLFHSDLKESLRYQSYCRAWHGQAGLYLGARSALLLPFKNLKLIVVDEEHDLSYKQSERSLYHARDLALIRAKQLQIPIVLGSATPSIETLVRAEQQNRPIFKLKKFYEAPKPKIQVLNLKDSVKSESGFISEELHQEIDRALDKNEQALLFLNRRGSVSQRICKACGWMDSRPECCTTNLTLHFDTQMAICHTCGFQKPIAKTCEDCGSKEFFSGGVGTKEIEVLVKARFPQARVARIDRDNVRKRGELGELIHDFASGKIDILVGTQMISKGIDIPNLSTVAMIFADQGWNFPDFRAMERSFQLMMQVMGRGGRRGQESRFLIQTLKPEHEIFQHLESENAWEDFSAKEIEIRKMAQLPPFSKMLLWSLSHKDLTKLNTAARALVERSQEIAKQLDVDLFGPVPSPIAKSQREHRVQVLAKAKDSQKLSSFWRAVVENLDQHPLGVNVKSDRDPYHFM